MDAFRLTWRLQRAEIMFAAGLCLGLAAATGWLAFDLRAISAACEPGAPPEAPCGVIYPFQTTHGHAVTLIQMVTSPVPLLAGLVLGVPIVARDIEHRTALIAWPLSGSAPLARVAGLYRIAAERYPEVLLRESAVLAAATVGVAAVAAAIVRRRRPE